MPGPRYQPIASDDHSPTEIDSAKKSRRNSRMVLWMFYTSVIFNLILVPLLLHFQLDGIKGCQATTSTNTMDVCRMEDRYNIAGKVVTKYQFLQDGLDDDDFKIGDEHWAQIFPVGNGVVYLTEDTVRMRNLLPSAISPGPGNLSVYEMAGYHSLHCLTSLRRTITGLLKGQKTGVPYEMNKDRWWHLRHCMGDIRQALLCHLDESLMSAPDLRTHPGDNQLRLCKELNPVNLWLEIHSSPDMDESSDS